ncbi:hypothetical protein D3C87_2071050 [compost metagenome]
MDAARVVARYGFDHSRRSGSRAIGLDVHNGLGLLRRQVAVEVTNAEERQGHVSHHQGRHLQAGEAGLVEFGQ